MGNCLCGESDRHRQSQQHGDHSQQPQVNLQPYPAQSQAAGGARPSRASAKPGAKPDRTTHISSTLARPSSAAGPSATVHGLNQGFQWKALSFEPVRYIPAGNRHQIRAFAVLSLLVVAYSKLKKGGNHWCFYLPVSNSRPIRIDPNPTGLTGTVLPGGTKANVVVSELSYYVSNQAEHVETVSGQGGLTVRDFIDAITNEGHHKYEFDKNGIGYRNSVTDQINLFWRGTHRSQWRSQKRQSCYIMGI